MQHQQGVLLQSSVGVDLLNRAHLLIQERYGISMEECCDALEIRLGDSKAISKEQVAEAISFSKGEPIEGERRIVLIERIDTMSVAAANALLNVLEEGPALFVCTAHGKVLPTICSRMESIYVSGETFTCFYEYVCAHYETHKDLASLLYIATDGCVDLLPFIVENLQLFLAIAEKLYKGTPMGILNDLKLVKERDNSFYYAHYEMLPCMFKYLHACVHQQILHMVGEGEEIFPYAGYSSDSLFSASDVLLSALNKYTETTYSKDDFFIDMVTFCRVLQD